MHFQYTYKFIIFIAVVICMVFIAESAGANNKIIEKVVPLPAVELEIIIVQWLLDKGFDASYNTTGKNQSQIIVKKEDKMWQVKLMPSSPLASKLFITGLNENQDKAEIDGLWSYLALYTQDESTDSQFMNDQFPEFIIPYSKSVVCIEGTINDEHIQFSGFILDGDNIVISTAHDLENMLNLTVTFYNGKKIKGTIIKADYDKDLSLIKITSVIKSSISFCQDCRI